MKILHKNWLTDLPFDFELKRYKLLGATQKLMSMIKAGFLHEALTEVEYQLEDLYKLKNKKNEIDDRLRVLTGINLDTMSLDYEYPETEDDIFHIYQLVEIAIEEFESLFRMIRVKWRSIASKLTVTEIPRTMPTKIKGIVFIIDKNTNILTYSYNNPYKLVGEWDDLILKKVDIDLKGVPDIIEYIVNSKKEIDDKRFWRIDHKLNEDHEECILPISRYSLYHKLTK
jgi:hypothetical protein